MVGSLISAVLGSSELRATPVAVRLAWLLTENVFAGNGVLMVASKVTVIFSPGRRVPTLKPTCALADVSEAASIAAATHSKIEIVFMFCFLCKWLARCAGAGCRGRDDRRCG